MYSCPACGSEAAAGRMSCACGADLTLLARLDGVADAWFNRGLEALASGSKGRALEWFAAACAARPTDAQARQALSKVWAQLGHFEDAGHVLQQAVAVDPTLPDLEGLRAAIAAAQTPAPAAADPRRPRRRGRR